MDFSRNGQYTNVIQSRVKVYLNARACIWSFCFVRVKKDDYLTLNFTPVMEVSTTLTTQPGNKLQYSFQLERFNLGANSDIGDVNYDFSKEIELKLFRPLGILWDRYFKPMVEKISNYLGEVSGIINPLVKALSLPRSGMIPIPCVLMGTLHSAISSCNRVNNLTNELSNIEGLLEDALTTVQPKNITCTGNM